MHQPFQNLSRRRADASNNRFNLFADGERFGELRRVNGDWQVLANCVSLAYCLHHRVRALSSGSSLDEALIAVRRGTEDYIRNEDDTAECFDDEMRVQIQQLRHLRQVYQVAMVRRLVKEEMGVETDLAETMKPTVAALRAVERELHLLPYEIGTASYLG